MDEKIIANDNQVTSNISTKGCTSKENQVGQNLVPRTNMKVIENVSGNYLQLIQL